MEKNEENKAPTKQKHRHKYIVPSKPRLMHDDLKKLQAKDKNQETFFRLIFRFMKGHVLITAFLLITVACSAATAFLSPKII